MSLEFCFPESCVSITASRQEIKKADRTQALQFHPVVFMRKNINQH